MKKRILAILMSLLLILTASSCGLLRTLRDAKGSDEKASGDETVQEDPDFRQSLQELYQSPAPSDPDKEAEDEADDESDAEADDESNDESDAEADNEADDEAEDEAEDEADADPDDAADWVTATVNMTIFDETSGGVSTTALVFNADGKKLSHLITPGSGETFLSNEFSYDESGRLSSSSTYIHPGSMEIFDDSSMSYSCDPQGRLSGMHISGSFRQVIDPDIPASEDDYSTDYVYSYEDDELTHITVMEDGTQRGEVDIRYQDDTMITNWYNADGELYEYSEWQLAPEEQRHDQAGFLTLDSIYSITAPQSKRSVLPFDLICLAAAYTDSGEAALAATTYFYDDHGNLSRYSSGDEEGLITYEYSDSGRIDSAHVVVLIQNENAPGYLKDGVTYSYSYDGDLVTSVLATNADGSPVEIWSITYQY